MNLAGNRRAARIAGSCVAAAALLAGTLTTAARANFSARTLAAPGYGGTINIPNGQVDCLDPQKTSLSASYSDFTYLFDSLVQLDKHGHPKPDLATSWKVANGGTQVTFNLRHGVRFSNGDPFTAKDVQFTYQRAVDPATKSPVSAGQFASVASVDVVNKYTARFNLKTPSRPLFTDLGNAYTGIVDKKAVQSEGDAGFCQKPIGTGPYKVESTGTAFDTVVLGVNKYHTWEPAIYSNHGLPYISKIVVHYLSNPATEVSELIAGQLDYSAVTGDQIGRVKGNKNIRLVTFKPQGELYLGFNTTTPPFNNLAVRKAVAEAINRSALIKAAANGLGLPQYSALGSGIPYYDKNAKKYLPAYNLNAARQAIAANHATGPYTFLIPAGIPEYATGAELIQAELASVGMTVNVVTKGIGDFISQAGKGDFDMFALGYGYPDPDVLYLLFNSANGKGAGLNFTNFVSSRIDNDTVKGRTTLNAKKAAKYYNDVQEFINKNVIVVPLWADTAPVGFRTRLKGCCDLNPNAGQTLVEYWVISK